MAKENTVYFYGRIAAAPKINRNQSTQEYESGKFIMTTMRRSYVNENLEMRGDIRLDVPCIYSRNEKLIREQMSNLKEGDMVYVKGSLSTQDVQKKYLCPYCGHVHVKSEAVIIYIDPLHVLLVKEGCSPEEGNKLLEKNCEISNQVFMYGTLCREPNYYYDDKTRKRECDFQVASNRKRRIEEDGPDKTTDYPCVKVFGPLAEETSKVLHTGSSIYINGAIETRTITQKYICENCNKSFEKQSVATEIVPYSIEYLHNCEIPVKEENEEELAGDSGVEDYEETE